MWSAAVERWRPLVTQNARGLPVEFLLAWMKAESGGNPAALGAITEVGLFQIDLQSGPQFGGDINTLHRNFATATGQVLTRPLTESEKLLQVTTGIAMVAAYRDTSRKQLAAIGADWPEGSSDFWNLVKLRHALPALGHYYLPAFKRVHDRAPSSWSEWARWLNSLTFAEAKAISSASAPYYFPDGSKGKGPHLAYGRFTRNAENAGQYGGVELLNSRFGSFGLLIAIAVAMYFLAR